MDDSVLSYYHWCTVSLLKAADMGKTNETCHCLQCRIYTVRLVDQEQEHDKVKI